MKREMLINVLQPEECRIAILEDGVLEELYVERTSHESYVGNIYKGRIVNIEPSIQAAFVDFGVGRNGFLHISDVEPTYYKHLEQGRGDRDDRRGGRDERRGDRDDRRGPGRDRDRDRGPVRERGRFEEDEAIYTPPGMETPADDTALEVDVPAAPVGDREDVFGGDLLTEAREEGFAEFQTPDSTPPAGESRLEDVRAEEASAASAEALEARREAVAEPVEPLVALPETQQLEDDPGPRGRRRGRGGARRRRGAAPEEAAGETPPPPPAEGDEPPAADRPRFMDSAERRTSEKDTGPEAPHEIQPPPGSGSFHDDDLFFPSTPAHAASAAPRQAEQAYRPSEPPPLPREADPVSEVREPSPEPSRPAPSEPRRERGRGGRDPRGGGRGGREGREGRGRSEGRSRPRSIEEELAADLDAADIGHEAPATFDDRPPAEHEPDTFDDAPVLGEDLAEDVRADEDEDLGGEAPPSAAGRPGRRDAEGGRDRGRDRGGRDRGRDRDRDRGPRNGRRMGGRPGMGRPKPLIQDVFRRGQEVIVQVIKEGIGTKGPTLSTYISIAGRYLVLMPGLNRVGVSRKIADDDQRRRLRDIFHQLQPPPGLGFIIRTAGVDRNAKELQRDLAYLSRLWQVVVRRIRKSKTPTVIYEESDMITRTIRDTFTGDIDAIYVDEPRAFDDAQEFMQVVMPRYANRIKLFEGIEPLFHKYGIEDEIARIQQRKVPLPNGGSIVIEQTEALVAIDVNSGNFRGDRNDAEATAYQVNLHAAKEIARQLRLRDLGGVIVNDFIDMRDEKHRRNVESAMRDHLKRDRARTKILKISPFGIIEMTRQRIRPSLKRSVYQDCPYCHGMAQVKTCESMSIEVMRLLQLASHRDYVNRVEVQVAMEVANYLQNKKRREIAKLEEAGNIQVQITGSVGLPPETLNLLCLDNNNNEVKLLPHEPVTTGRPRR